MRLKPSPVDLDEAQRAHLAEVLRDPVLVQAVDIAIRGSLPVVQLATAPSETQAAIGNQMAGMNMLVNRLVALSEPEAGVHIPPDPSDEGGWEHLAKPIQPEDTTL